MVANRLRNDHDFPEFMKLTPVYEVEEYGVPTSTISKYVVDTSEEGIGQYSVKASGKYVHVIAKDESSGEQSRYRINLETKMIDKLVFRDMQVSTMDFTTQYSYDQLCNNLLANVKQWMLNVIVQTMLNNVDLTTIPLDMWHKELHLDLFTDSQSLDNYVVSEGASPTGDEANKFQEVFKNDLNIIDDSRIYDGNVYQYFVNVM